MNRALDELLTAMPGVTDDDGLRRLVGGYLADNGFEGFLFSVYEDTEIRLMCSCGQDLVLQYRRDGYDVIDPVQRQARSSWLPVVWDAYDYLDAPSRDEVRLFEMTLEFGYERGVSVPLRGPFGSFDSFVALTRQGRGEFLGARDEWVRQFMLIGNYMSSVYHGVLHRDETGTAELTRRELECLHWTAQGKTAWEVARLIDVSERTVQFHIRNACGKMNAVSKHQAALKAAHMGLIRI